MQNGSHHPVAKLLKVATLRPGLVRLAIFDCQNHDDMHNLRIGDTLLEAAH